VIDMRVPPEDWADENLEDVPIDDDPDGSTGSGPDDNSWPDPKPIVAKLPPVELFTPEMLPTQLSDYVIDIADRQQAPPDYAAVASVCGAGAMLGNRVRIRPKQQDDWEVVCNPWGANIGRPSSGKSPAMRSALAPCYALQADMREAWKAGLDARAADDALAALAQKSRRKQAEKAMLEGEHNKARELLSEVSQEEKKDPPCPRLIVNDTSVEKLGELLNQNPRGLLLVRDELHGFLSRMEDERFSGERAFYLEAFNGLGPFTYDRIGRGTVHIENCTLGMVGGIQPTRIASLVSAAVEGSNNDGLVQRLQLAIWPDAVGSWRWIDRKPGLVAKLTYEETFKRLHRLGLDHLILRFSEEAQFLFREWMVDLQTKARGNTLSSIVESHMLKLPKTIASLALLFEVIEDGRDAVGKAATERALRWSPYLQSHAKRLYAAADVMTENGAKLIVERRSQLPSPFTARDVQRKGWAGLADRDLVQTAIETLIATHHCRAVSPQRGVFGRSRSEEHYWNPALSVS
jgi:hypothetical protein